MVLYRRNVVPGGSFFFTLTLRDRRARTLVEHIDLLRTAYAEVQRRRPFRTDAVVVLPDHLHAIWTLPEGDADYSGRWRAIKAGFVRGLARAGVALDRNPKGEALVWQRRFWHPARRLGLRRALRLHPLQPGETRACRPANGLATFDAASVYRTGGISPGLVGSR